MRKAPLLVAFSLLAASGSTVAQAPKPEALEERPASPLGPREPRLNLNLDHPAKYARETPSEDAGSAAPLPSLGGDARALPASPKPATTTTGPFPKDAERGER